jgi:hypothetical protein
MSIKAAPKTFNQVRNFLYASAAMAGYVGGRHEKFESDALWSAYQLKSWKEDYDQKEAARVAAHPPSTEIPAGVPEELGELYKALKA